MDICSATTILTLEETCSTDLINDEQRSYPKAFTNTDFGCACLRRTVSSTWNGRLRNKGFGLLLPARGLLTIRIF